MVPSEIRNPRTARPGSGRGNVLRKMHRERASLAPGRRNIADDSGSSRQQVIDIAEMSDETFVMHMNKRHRGSLGGLRALWVAPDTMPIWRIFHARLHDLRIDLKHEHERTAG